jgi:hypothetical protein
VNTKAKKPPVAGVQRLRADLEKIQTPAAPAMVLIRMLIEIRLAPGGELRAVIAMRNKCNTNVQCSTAGHFVVVVEDRDLALGSSCEEEKERASRIEILKSQLLLCHREMVESVQLLREGAAHGWVDLEVIEIRTTTSR